MVAKDEPGMSGSSVVPSTGLEKLAGRVPSDKSLGYSQASLRDARQMLPWRGKRK